MNTTTRRPSYGPTSPTIGGRGRGTRRAIAQHARELFASQGYRSSSMDQLAALAGVSKATLYQYFASKEAIFTELSAESGLRLLSAADGLAPFGPTEAGVESLAQWLTVWFQDTTRFGPLLLDWHCGLDPSSPLRPMVALFIELHTPRLADHLARSGIGDDALSTALTLHAVVEGFNYLRLAFRQPRTDADLLRGLLELAQLALYPDTRDAVLAHARTVALPALGTAAVPDERRWSAPPPAQRRSPSPSSAPSELLRAATAEFADRGYHATSVENIAIRAGISRTKFYKHFANRAAVFDAVTETAVSVFETHYAALAAVATADRPGRALHRWLRSNQELQETYIGVSRVWIETPLVASDAMRSTVAVMRCLGASVAALKAAPNCRYVANRTAAVLAVAALLNALPDIATGHEHALDTESLLDRQTRFLSNVFLGGAT